MFTGIIKAQGTVAAIDRSAGDVRLSIRSAALPWSDYAVGESISVNGVCLTAVSLHEDGFDADVSNETLAVTALADIDNGDIVNLEPALGASERLGGHIVSGHVDCVGTVAAIAKDDRSIRLTIEIEDAYRRYVAKKGSICIDGVSLTINEVSGRRVELNIIPHTADVTNIGSYRVGTKVNIEVDVVARYLESLLGDTDNEITMEFLRAHGYG